jgi:hypothetical protein
MSTIPGRNHAAVVAEAGGLPERREEMHDRVRRRHAARGAGWALTGNSHHSVLPDFAICSQLPEYRVGGISEITRLYPRRAISHETLPALVAFLFPSPSGLDQVQVVPQAVDLKAAGPIHLRFPSPPGRQR